MLKGRPVFGDPCSSFTFNAYQQFVDSRMTVLQARLDAVQTLVNRSKRELEYPRNSKTGKPEYPSEIFGQHVFGIRQLKENLPKPIFAEFTKQMAGGRTMTKQVADAVAHAVRIWAMDKGATHFTHWFQPQTDSTAEKHDSFLSVNYTSTAHGIEVR